MNAEEKRLIDNAAREVPLELWGPYLSERQWGTVREDYSDNGDAWNYFTHDQARSRAYRWGEDGLAGISDYNQDLCFSIALWNGKDAVLKERLFGLTNQEGNHGEDVKELYYYLDNVPTHYYMKHLYKYPQAAYPYLGLIEENRRRTKQDPEYEILDTGIFSDGNYFDVYTEYAKQDSEDIFIRISIVNRHTEGAAITVLPTLWFANKWQFDSSQKKPVINYIDDETVEATHDKLGEYYLYCQTHGTIWFTENETNRQKIEGTENDSVFVKDLFHEAVISGSNREALAINKKGTKCAVVYELEIGGGSTTQLYFRLTKQKTSDPFPNDPAILFDTRIKEADVFYASLLKGAVSPELALIRRQAYAGLLWSKQYYHYDVETWCNPGNGSPAFYEQRKEGRNSEWKNLKNKDVIMMPDKWEYPWYAAWDLSFHCIAMAGIDPVFAKNQLIILTREWYMNAAGQIPAYEWNFSDVNPPVQAFAAMQVYKIDKEKTGKGDLVFLKRIFQKLMINFTWWANRKDADGNNIFGGGFLGLDNIGIFNRSLTLPNDAQLEQSDGTAWMGMYALDMMDIALEISLSDISFEDTAIKFYEHFVLIAEALNEKGLWDTQDNFYYDVLHLPGDGSFPLRLRSMVGLIPLFAVSSIRKEHIEKLPGFKRAMDWLHNYRTLHHRFIPDLQGKEKGDMLTSMVDEQKIRSLMGRMLDEAEFLAPGGIRALSKYYRDHPFAAEMNGTDYLVSYDPGDSTSGLFGGNSNWRGPVWIPMNYLLVEAIRAFGDFYGNTLTVEFPNGSGEHINLKEVAARINKRILGQFLPGKNKTRAIHGKYNWFYQLPGNENLCLFYEYFHGDNASGVGASHQTGWTALVVNLTEEERKTTM
jgi:hypothetical protein